MSRIRDCRSRRWQLFCFHADYRRVARDLRRTVACHIWSSLGCGGQTYDILWRDTVYSVKSITDFWRKVCLHFSNFIAICKVRSYNLANGFRSKPLFWVQKWQFSCMWLGVFWNMHVFSDSPPPTPVQWMSKIIFWGVKPTVARCLSAFSCLG